MPRTNPGDAVTITEGNFREDISRKGLTKREYFAGLALQGLLANPELNENPWDTFARDAVAAAEELVNALNGEFDHE